VDGGRGEVFGLNLSFHIAGAVGIGVLGEGGGGGASNLLGSLEGVWFLQKVG